MALGKVRGETGFDAHHQLIALGFVDFLEPRACIIAFVLQHGSERAPCLHQHKFPGARLYDAMAGTFTLPTKRFPEWRPVRALTRAPRVHR